MSDINMPESEVLRAKYPRLRRNGSDEYKWRSSIDLPGFEAIAFMGYVEKIEAGIDNNTACCIVINSDDAVLVEMWNENRRTPDDFAPLGILAFNAKKPEDKWSLLDQAVQALKSGDLSGIVRSSYNDRRSSIVNGQHVDRIVEIMTSLDVKDEAVADRVLTIMGLNP